MHIEAVFEQLKSAAISFLRESQRFVDFTYLLAAVAFSQSQYQQSIIYLYFPMGMACTLVFLILKRGYDKSTTSYLNPSETKIQKGP